MVLHNRVRNSYFIAIEDCHAYDKFKNGLHKLTGEIEEGKHDEASF